MTDQPPQPPGEQPAEQPGQSTPAGQALPVPPARAQNLAAHLAAWLRNQPPGTTVDQLDCGDLAAVALAVDAAYLASLDPHTGRRPVSPEQAHQVIEAAAQMLAERSGNPRYGDDGYGWTALLDGEHNVENAFAMAVRATGGATDELRQARQLLLRHAATPCRYCRIGGAAPGAAPPW